jgi:acetyltransferase-like isoleucine patch superfamily enzyme
LRDQPSGIADGYDGTVIRKLLKNSLYGVFLVAAAPIAALSGFGRVKPIYAFFAQSCATVPGGIGDYFRVAYYRLTLAECHMSSRISFGTFFAHPEARVGARVYIGSYCIMGKATIGEGTQVASAVQILSGQHQHIRDASGAFYEAGDFKNVSVGADCWLGAGAIVMADVGPRTTIGAASVAVGSPARVIRGEGAALPDTV